jgi:CubicO group peptidase (beta-lactamase class C family)
MRRLIYCFSFLFFVACKSNPGKNKAEKIDYLVQDFFDDNEFIGNVLVADQGKIIFKKSFGREDQQRNVQNTDNTKFLIGSISKPITAILILRLADKGVLKLDDTINKYFAKVDSQIGKINIHQLLTHTSGINEIIDKEENIDIPSLIGKAKLKFAPGSDFEYSNSGYVLLKEIAEIATQKDYGELVKAEIFDPSDMASSGVARSSNLTNLARGYKDATQADIAIMDFPIENVDGAGSIYSTVEDLYRLDRILYTESLLSKKMTEQLLKQHVPEKYSYGWFVRERGGMWDVYWHKGDLPGFTSFISRRVQKNQVVVILSNAGNLDVSNIENGIAKILNAPD